MENAHKEFWRIRRMHVKNCGVNGAYAEIFYALVEKAEKNLCVNRESVGKSLVIHQWHEALLGICQKCLLANREYAERIYAHMEKTQRASPHA
jgi:hypothetical protein